MWSRAVDVDAPEFVSTPNGPGSNKRYRMYIANIVGDWACCYPFMTKRGQGWSAVDPQLRSLYALIFQEGSQFELPEGGVRHYFTTRKEPANQVLLLEPCWVSFDTFISVEADTMTPESQVRIHDDVHSIASVGGGLAGIAQPGVDVEERAQDYRSLGTPGPGEKITFDAASVLRKTSVVSRDVPKASGRTGRQMSRTHTASHTNIPSRIPRLTDPSAGQPNNSRTTARPGNRVPTHPVNPSVSPSRAPQRAHQDTQHRNHTHSTARSAVVNQPLPPLEARYEEQHTSVPSFGSPIWQRREPRPVITNTTMKRTETTLEARSKRKRDDGTVSGGATKKQKEE